MNNGITGLGTLGIPVKKPDGSSVIVLLRLPKLLNMSPNVPRSDPPNSTSVSSFGAVVVLVYLVVVIARSGVPSSTESEVLGCVAPAAGTVEDLGPFVPKEILRPAARSENAGGRDSGIGGTGTPW